MALFSFEVNVHHHHHHYHHFPELIDMSQQLEDLRREVAEAKDASASAVALIVGLKARLDALLTSELELADLKAQIAGLSQELSNSTDSLAAAVAADGPGGDTPNDEGGDTPPSGGDETPAGGGEDPAPGHDPSVE